jgi:predicted acetyltransferase
MELVKASGDPQAGLEEFLSEPGAESFAGGTARVDQLGLSGFLKRLVNISLGEELPDGWIPCTTFWLLDGAKCVVGVSNLRHSLTPSLTVRGGHIGYYVASSKRGRGYGRIILASTLKEARAMGMSRVLLTTDSTNIPSMRVIERNGGVLEDERPDPETGAPYKRYWIALDTIG